MRYAGIDSGLKGAIAIFEDRKLVNCYTLPYDKEGNLDIKVFKVYLSGIKGIIIEKPAGIANRRGMLTNFTNFGEIKGICRLLVNQVEIVYPNTWKKHYGLGSDKSGAIQLAKDLYPEINLKRSKRSRKDDDNIAEAILLGHYLFNR